MFIFFQASWVDPCHVFFVMWECRSIFILMHLEGYLLFIADRCHIWIACHFQTVTPIPVILISFSSDFISPFQWHTWISMLRPGSFIPLQIMHMHRIPHPAYHIMFMCWLFTMLCASFRCCFFGLVPLTSRCEAPFIYVRLSSLWTRSSSSRDFRQDDHTLEITTIFAMLVCSLFCHANATMPTTCLSATQIAMSNL